MMGRRRGEAGFTLIETVAAVGVFAIMTLGTVPLLATTLKGSALSRSYAVAKNSALDSMERIRGLPFFVSYDSQARKVDVLDLYFPCSDPTLARAGCSTAAAGGSYDATANKWTFTTICTATTVNPACPANRPFGVTFAYTAQFVRPTGSPETLPAVQPTNSYTWAVGGGTDSPPSQLVQISVTAEWRSGGSATCTTIPVPAGCRSMKLVSLIGDRRFGTVKITGDATVGYGMQVITRYADSVGLSDLTAIGGGAESKIEQRLTSTADQTIRSGVLRLVEEPNAQSSSATQIASVDGINLSYHAPPAQAPNPLPTSAAQVMNHPNITPSLSIAGMTATNTPATPTVSASVANELPSASGGFNFTTTAVSGFAGSGYFWVDNQVPTDPRSTLLAIDPTKQVLRTTTTTPTMSGSTSSNATALTPTSTRGVFSSAQISLNNVRIMPTTFISPQPKTAFVVDSFSASTTCNSTVSSGAAAVDRGTWDATVEVFVDTSNNGVQGGSYQTLTFHGDSTAGNVTVSGTLNGTTYTNAPFSQLAANLVSSDPLVLDGVAAGTDAYLIQDASHPNGYLTAWTATNPVASVDTAKTTTTASITGAMNVATVATNSSIPESGLNILFGKLSCTSFDNRG